MLLRGSGEHSATAVELTGVIPALGAVAGVAGEGCLNELADAFYAGDLERAREGVVTTLGSEALVDAAGIIGMFDAVVRVADATGIPLEDYKVEASEDFRAVLGISDFHPDKS